MNNEYEPPHQFYFVFFLFFSQSLYKLDPESLSYVRRVGGAVRGHVTGSVAARALVRVERVVAVVAQVTGRVSTVRYVHCSNNRRLLL